MSGEITLRDKSERLQKQLDQRMIEIAKALPAETMTPQHFARTVVTLCGKNPKLLDCNFASLIGAIMQSAQLGLSPDPVLGEAWFVPFRDVVTFIPGYKGLIKLAYQSDQVAKVTAHVVRDGDDFDYEYGLKEKLTHKPKAPMSAKVTHAYATLKIKGGDTLFLVLTREEIEAIRKRSPAVKSGKSTPWDTDPEAMAMKSALRRVCKLGPSSVTPKLQRALQLDEQAENGLKQHLSEPFLLPNESDTERDVDEQELANAALEAEKQTEDKNGKA